MLEEAIPSVWTSLHSWFTPAVFFVLLNLVIGTIAVTSKGRSSSSSPTAPSSAGDTYGRTGALTRAPSLVLDQIRSFSFSRYAHHDEIPLETGHIQSENAPVAGGGSVLTRAPSLVFDRLRSFNLSRFVSGEHQAETGPGLEPPTDVSPLPDSASASQVEEEEEEEEAEHHNEHHMERSHSDARSPVPKLPVRMKKSASHKSAFSHFEAAEISKQQTLDEDDGEVDAKADDFINKFRNQLKLQRLDSIIRYKEMLTRGAAS